MNNADLSRVLTAHCAWLNNEANGQRANLSGANLSEANLREANLSGETVLDTGETWATYCAETLPQLLLASDRGVAAIAAWGNHSWSDCPMHVAFQINNAEKAPALLRPRVRQFVQLFDADLVPQPTPEDLLRVQSH